MHKKVLIIAYYWPPAGGPGVQRWLKFVKYLPDFNINPIVFVPKNANYPIVDESLKNEISKELTIVKHPIKEPYKFAKLFSKKNTNTISKGIINERKKQSFLEKLMLFVRGNFFIPDARVGWVNSSVRLLSKYIIENNIDIIITTGPPHSLHLIGLKLKQKLQVKWLADFRDPWTTIGYHKQLKLTKGAQKKHKKLEKVVLNTADKIIVTSFTTKETFKTLTSKPIEVVTNGYDDEIEAKPSLLDKKFTIAHIGSFLSKRNPEILWRVFSELLEEETGFKNDFQLNLVGLVSENVLQSIKDYNLIDYLNEEGYVSHKESIDFQKKSQLLLLVEIDSEDTKCIIPGKLFEYMVSNRPIIAIGPENSDVSKIIAETNAGAYFSYLDYQLLKNTIKTHYRAYKANNLIVNPIGLQKYHRKQLTKSLSQLI